MIFASVPFDGAVGRGPCAPHPGHGSFFAKGRTLTSRRSGSSPAPGFAPRRRRGISRTSRKRGRGAGAAGLAGPGVSRAGGHRTRQSVRRAAGLAIIDAAGMPHERASTKRSPSRRSPRSPSLAGAHGGDDQDHPVLPPRRRPSPAGGPPPPRTSPCSARLLPGAAAAARTDDLPEQIRRPQQDRRRDEGTVGGPR